MSYELVYPSVGNLSLRAWWRVANGPPNPQIAGQVNHFIEPPYRSDDNWANGGGPDGGENYLTIPGLPPLPGAAEGDLYWISVWAPIGVRLHYDLNGSPVTCTVVDIDTWVYGGNGTEMQNFRIEWPI